MVGQTFQSGQDYQTTSVERNSGRPPLIPIISTNK